MTRKQREEDQPLPVQGGVEVSPLLKESIANYGLVGGYSQALIDAIARDVDERTALGIKRYGSTLQTNNGRDVCRDQYEELLDAAQYGKQRVLQSSCAHAQRLLYATINLLYEHKECKCQ